MTARKSRDTKSRLPEGSFSRQGESSPSTPSGHFPSSAAIRETIESVVIAFILAFLFRTFEAEAFIIPTGSMAPTLMGRHKDVECPKCGCPYRISSSSEVTAEGARIVVDGEPRSVTAGTCPMCRHTATEWGKAPSYNGDRILVGKPRYQFSDPRRWDVIVFKFPGDGETDARTNFIKRLIGLPGETVRIENGDIWIRRPGGEPDEFHLERKPPGKLLAVLQPVFDNRYMPAIAELGWPERWRPEPTAAGEPGWTSDDRVAFRADGSAPGENWLRYEHRIPSFRQWRRFLDTGRAEEAAPQLITDFMAYDTGRFPNDDFRLRGLPSYPQPPENSLGEHWVGDLVLCCTVEVLGESGELVLELRKGGRQFQCRVDVATGRATLAISGEDAADFQPTAATGIRGPGRHELRYSNCDNQLLLWVDGRLVSFDASTAYDERLRNHKAADGDLQPIGIASVGAALEISDLNVMRDIYYIALKETPYREHAHVDFDLEEDQFFVLGDNSAFSKDSRLWGHDNHYVPRELLIGKALFIYWPHSYDRIPYLDIPFPFFPNFKDMGFVR